MNTGLFVYFYYGIKHSALEPQVDEDERIELKIKSQTTKPETRQTRVPPKSPPKPSPTFASCSSTASVARTATAAPVTAVAHPAAAPAATPAAASAATAQTKAEPKRPTNLEPLPANNDSSLFVSPSAFPKWDD